MGRGLRRVPDTNPPNPSLGSHNSSSVSLQSFLLSILVQCKKKSGGDKKTTLLKSRCDEESREVVHTLCRPACFESFSFSS